MKKIVTALMLAGMVSAPGIVMAAEAEAATATTTITTAAPAEETSPVTGNITIASDYRFRGVSQTLNGPTIQGGFDYAHESGVYLGFWAANVSEAELAGANIEMDFYAGYNWQLDDDTSINAGGIYYWYPNSDESAFGFDPNSFDLYVGGTWKWFNVKYFYTVTDYFGLADSSGTSYLEGNINYTLPYDITLSAHLGGTFAAGSDNGDYTDWKIGVSKEFYGFNVGLAYVDTDIDSDTTTWGGLTEFPEYGGGTKDLAAATAVLSIGKTF